MMKLYYSPGACSLSPHIALREADLSFDLVRVDLGSKTLEDGSNYRSIYPLGYVPLLELDDGTRLSEGPAIVQYIADRVPDKHLAPAHASFQRYVLQQWLNFVSTEIHQGYGVVFHSAHDACKEEAKARLLDRYAYVDLLLGKQRYLLSDAYTVADIYLFVTVTWAKYASLDLTPLGALQRFVKEVSQRPAVQAALKAEGLL